MRFNIYKASVIYGGGPMGPEFRLIFENVDASFIKGYFANIFLVPGTFKTTEDSMGCYEIYRIEVSQLERP